MSNTIKSTFKSTIKSAFGSLAPLWSNEISKSFSLSGEYKMAITMILSEVITFVTDNFDEKILYFLIFVGGFLITLKYFGVTIINLSNILKQPTSISVSGTEKYNLNETNLLCSKAFKSVNLMLIKKYGIKKLRYLKDNNFDIIVDNMVDHKLEEDLFVTVSRNPSNENQRITITLYSYNKNLDKILSDAMNLYDDDDKLYKLKLVGSELYGNSYNYPDVMKYLTYVLVNNYNMTKLKILSERGPYEKQTDDDYQSTKTDIKNANKKAEETQLENIEDLGKQMKNIFLLESCKNYKLEDDVFITIERNENNVTYTLLSNTVDLKEFLKKCIEIYKKGISLKDYKYVLKLIGTETITSTSSKLTYPKNLLALCDKLINDGHVNNFRLIESDKTTLKIIDEINNITFDDILINSVRSIQSPNYWEKFLHTTYILESNTVNLTEYIEECLVNYEKNLINKNKGIIYYFKYLGKFGKELKFSKSILSSCNNELTETFENIHNEHSDRLKREIAKLKDLEYYKKTGLRRKKAYLFYGEPGCGKNASVVAMALHDSRHIIDIPFSILQYNSEFSELMNLTSICDVSFKKDQIIYMFDEMHTGLAKICKGQLKKQNDQKDENNTKQELIDAMTQNTKEPSEKMSYDSLDLGCVLSVLDGIGNYGGVIYVGLTNYIEKIPEPLKRSLRLTPVKFTYLRKYDVLKIIESFFEINLSQDLVDKLPDRKISPARLRVLCEQNETMNIGQFVDLIISESELETRQHYCDTDNTEKYLNLKNKEENIISDSSKEKTLDKDNSTNEDDSSSEDDK